MAKKDTRDEEGPGLWGMLRKQFGNVARQLGFVGGEDVLEALDEQEERKASRRPHRKIGQILVEQGKMEDGHVKEVLKEQKKGGAKARKKAAEKAKKKVAAKPKTGGKKAAKKKAKNAKKAKR
jgi:hypothetical protein